MDAEIKTALVCLGDRKREVAFASKGGREALIRAVREVFNDVLSDDDDSDEQLLLQIKNEEWNGEFVDLVSEVPDRSVLKVVVVKCASDNKPSPSHAVMQVCGCIIMPASFCLGELLNCYALMSATA